MDNSLPPQDRPSLIRRHWLSLLFTLTAGGLAILLAIPLDSPFAASCLFVAVTGWILYRFVQANAPGVFFLCISAVAFSEMYWRISSPADNETLLMGLIIFISLSTSSICFLIAAIKTRTRQVVNCLGCVLPLFILVNSCVIGSKLHNFSSNQNDVEETTRTLMAVLELAQEIDTLQKHLGRLPNDEAELVLLLGKPMPTFGSHHVPIHYYRNGDSDYHLNFDFRSFWGYRWDLFGYVATYSSCNANPRLFVDLF